MSVGIETMLTLHLVRHAKAVAHVKMDRSHVSDPKLAGSKRFRKFT